MADVAKLADELLALTIMEAKELNDILEEKGIKVAAPVAMAGLGLKEAKDLVEAAPKAVKEGVAKGEAEELKKKLEEAGATVELK